LPVILNYWVTSKVINALTLIGGEIESLTQMSTDAVVAGVAQWLRRQPANNFAQAK